MPTRRILIFKESVNMSLVWLTIPEKWHMMHVTCLTRTETLFRLKWYIYIELVLLYSWSKAKIKWIIVCRLKHCEHPKMTSFRFYSRMLYRKPATWLLPANNKLQSKVLSRRKPDGALLWSLKSRKLTYGFLHFFLSLQRFKRMFFYLEIEYTFAWSILSSSQDANFGKRFPINFTGDSKRIINR